MCLYICVYSAGPAVAGRGGGGGGGGEGGCGRTPGSMQNIHIHSGGVLGASPQKNFRPSYILITSV